MTRVGLTPVARAICRMDSPASLAATMAQMRSRSASASRVMARGDHLLLATDTLLQGLRGFHTRKDTRFSFSCTEN